MRRTARKRVAQALSVMAAAGVAVSASGADTDAISFGGGKGVLREATGEGEANGAVALKLQTDRGAIETRYHRLPVDAVTKTLGVGLGGRRRG